MDAERLTAAVVIAALVSIPFGIFCLVCHFSNRAPVQPHKLDKYRDDLFI